MTQYVELRGSTNRRHPQGTLRCLGLREDDIDDALQEAFLVVCQRLDDYEETGRARAWLSSICARVVHGQRRKVSRRRETTLTERLELTAPPTQLQHVARREALALGQQLLSQLPPPQREVFVRHAVDDVPMVEVAQAMHCPVQTAYARLHKARARILPEVERVATESRDAS